VTQPESKATFHEIKGCEQHYRTETDTDNDEGALLYDLSYIKKTRPVYTTHIMNEGLIYFYFYFYF
jgi:hypothetical protein